MIKKEDIVGFENDWVFIAEDSITVYKFLDNGTGEIDNVESVINFKWKINSKGLLNITYNGELLFYKLLKKENSIFFFEEYVKDKETKKIKKSKNIYFSREDLNTIETTPDYSKKETKKINEVIKEIKEDKILLYTVSFFSFIIFCLLFIIFLIAPLISSLNMGVLLLIAISLTVISFKKIYLLSFLINNKYKDKIKKILF